MLAVTSPLLIVVCVAIWVQDRKSPLFVAQRLRSPDEAFAMVKLRTMVVNAPSMGGTSTAASDPRITPVGRIIRKFKFDEFPQLLNVIAGDMSLVGPRPQLARDAALYTQEERRLFNVRPGITDISSIVFSDEADILRNQSNPDLAYQQLIRPWKSRLGLLYVDLHTPLLDVALLALTAVALVSREAALIGVATVLHWLDADDQLVRVASRKVELTPYPPPGSDAVETRY